MLVRYRMTKEPVTVEPDQWLSDAAHKMQAGGFRRLPVVSDGRLVGIVTDRDARQHHGRLEQTKIKEAMTESPLITVTPATTLEEAAGIMLEQQ
ncbi:MAG TPA: CBS domain-containing protein, partial [Candidatus Binatia bacterium]|nr:CBS domain-containing protein [Candidatus Binatia bacterium]